MARLTTEMQEKLNMESLVLWKKIIDGNNSLKTWKRLALVQRDLLSHSAALLEVVLSNPAVAEYMDEQGIGANDAPTAH